MNIIVLSRHKIEKTTFNKPVYVISITTPGDPIANINGSVVDILRLQFDDVASKDEMMKNGVSAEAADKFIIFNDQMADLILTSVKRWIKEKKAKTIVIHCDAGISRSAAVAAALSIIFNGDQGEFVNGARYFPNANVKSTIVRRLWEKLYDMGK